MNTLLEDSQKTKALEAKRIKNLKMLNEKLDEAELLFSVIGTGTSEQDEERDKVRIEIERLKGFIESEQRALKEMNEASDPEIDAVMERLSI